MLAAFVEGPSIWSIHTEASELAVTVSVPVLSTPSASTKQQNRPCITSGHQGYIGDFL